MNANLRAYTGPALAAWAMFLAFFTGNVRSQPLAWVQREGWREAAVTVPVTGKTGFTLLRPEETGLFFINSLPYNRAESNQNLMNGCGVAAGDYDGDGLCDLYFANSEGPNGLFRNLGSGRFENMTGRAGVECTNQATKGVIFADINGDGRLDLLTGSLGGPNASFLNLGDGRFTNITTAAGLLSRAGSHSLALADVDGDGDLDLYVANYGVDSILRSGGTISTRRVDGREQVTGRWARRVKLIDGLLVEFGEPDLLSLNDGRGNFTPVSWTGGSFLTEEGQPLKGEPMDMGLSVMFRDINRDGHPDLYVCNDFQGPDRIWINDGRGRFRALPDLAVRTTSHFSMGVDFADIDRDGHDDFFVGDMLSREHRLRMTQSGATNPPASQVGQLMDRRQARRNVLNLNRGDGTYADIANFAGVAATDWTWSVVFLDVDLDGFEDLLVVNAHAYDTQDLDMHEKAPSDVRMGDTRRIGKSLKEFPPLITPNYAFHNRQNRTFEEVGAAWGFHSTNVSHGIALGDFDNDGDLDVAVSCLWQPPLLYRNESTAPRLAVRLRGRPPNTQGIGARVTVRGGAVPEQAQEIQCGGRYLSADDTVRVFAAGTLTNRLTIEVAWRSGQRSVITNARPNHIYEVDEAFSHMVPATNPPASLTPALFSDVSSLLNHRHEETPIHDFARQPLLYRSLARLGPGLAWIDLDRDGHDELIVGGNFGGQLAIFGGAPKGALKRWTADTLTRPLTRDHSGLTAWTPSAGRVSLLVGQSNYRDGAESTPALTLAGAGSAGGGVTIQDLAGARLGSSSVGPLAVADVDADGDLDVFVGGRVIPGRYPEAATSALFRNENGTLKPDATNSATLKGVGLVSGAVFSDLTGDGWPELILACEWGPLKILRNERGKLTAWDPPTQSLPAPASLLSALRGFWNGVTTGDFDGDGRLDLAAGNWGLNSSFGDPSRQMVKLYYGDFDNNGTLDLLEAETEPVDGRVLPRRNLMWLAPGWPSLRVRFPTHRSFASVDVPAVLEKAPAREWQVNTMASLVLLNRGDRLEVVQLPDEAQWAPAFGLTVADFEGDGAEDLFLSQNCFALRLDEPRLDAGRGLLLRGDGKGRFQPVSGPASGVKIYGDQRGCAAGDFDEDGRTDLAVAQNGGGTRLLRNERAQPGLRVRLQGPPGNPAGLGAVVWLVFGEKPGPAREIRGGSGYWSQDSVVPVLATPRPPASISVRWPGGQVTTAPVPVGARELSVDTGGKVSAVRTE